MYKNEIVEKYARDTEDKLVLARLLDKMEEAERKNILTSTHFLNENQRALAEMLIKAQGNPRHLYYGGYDGALRSVALFLPDYMEPFQITDERIQPLACIRADYSKNQKLSHRDFLGALMGCGIKRETVGDILVREGSCDIIVLKEILPYVASNLESAGRARLNNTVIPLSHIIVPEAEFKLIKDTVASLRLDSIVSSGFSISREKAAGLVKSGKVFLNYAECTKPDKPIEEGDAISARGMGKFELNKVGHMTKKGRVAVVLKKLI